MGKVPVLVGWSSSLSMALIGGMANVHVWRMSEGSRLRNSFENQKNMNFTTGSPPPRLARRRECSALRCRG